MLCPTTHPSPDSLQGLSVLLKVPYDVQANTLCLLGDAITLLKSIRRLVQTLRIVQQQCSLTNTHTHIQEQDSQTRRHTANIAIHTYCSPGFFVEKYLVFEKFVLKYFLVAASPQKFFNNEIIFNLPFFVYGCGTTSDDRGVRTEIRTARTTNGSVTKGELLSRLPCLFGHLGYGNWRASACCVFESPIMNMIDILLL